MNINVYQGRDDERHGLTSIAKGWPSDVFWSADEIIKSLECNQQCAMFYTETESIWDSLLFTQWAGSQAELLFIFVHPHRRQGGLAKHLMQHFVESMLRNKVETIFLEVRPSNLNAISLYERVGFSFLSRRSRYYSDGEDAIIMQMELLSSC